MKINEIEDNAHKLILRDCSQFLKESQGRPLWRGASREINGIVKLPAVTDRQHHSPDALEVSGGSTDLAFAFINSALKKKFNMDRSDSRLFSGNTEITDGYGISYMCFPLDGYKYLWAPGVDDYASELMGYWDHYTDDDGNYAGDEDDYEAFEEDHYNMVTLFLNDAEYRSNNLVAALKDNVEILIKGPFYMVADDPVEFYQGLKT